jgi:protein-tyrosine phosphatase
MDHSQVLPEVYIGSCPETPEDIDQLQRKLGVTAVLSLQTDEDLERLGCDWPRLRAHYRRLHMRVRRVPVRDYDRDDLRKHLPQCVQALNELLRDHHTVYVHCTAGMGRSPAVVITYLNWVRQYELDHAVQLVTNSRPSSPDLEAIRLAGEDVWGEAEE